MVNLVNGSKYYLAENNVSNGEGNGNALQCSCLENPMGRGAWWAMVYGVAKSWIRLSNSHTHTHKHTHTHTPAPNMYAR